MKPATHYDELNTVLKEFVSRLEAVLGDNMLAVYLTGSFALGGGDEDSDVDFLVIIADDIADEQLPQLEAMHQSLFEIQSYWSHHLEGSYLPKKLLEDTAPFTPIVYIDNGSKVLERSTHDNSLVVRWVTREHGITLYGTEPKTYLDPIPVSALKAEVKAVMFSWGQEILNGDYVIDNVWAQSFAVIMYCRMLHSLETGTISAKPDAVKWGQNTLDKEWHTLIREAWEKRRNQYAKVAEAAPAEEVSRTIEFIRYSLKLSETYQP